MLNMLFVSLSLCEYVLLLVPDYAPSEIVKILGYDVNDSYKESFW